MGKIKYFMVVALLILFSVTLSSTAFAEEQLNLTENIVSEKSEFKSKFVNPEIYIPSFDTSESAVKSLDFIEFKGNISSLKTSEERSEFLIKLDATRLDVREEIGQYLYPKGPIIGYGWNINGSFYVTYYENASVEKNTTDKIYVLIQEKAEIQGIEDIPVLFRQGVFLKTTSGMFENYEKEYRPIVGGIQVKNQYLNVATLGFTAINPENYDKGYVVANHFAGEEDMSVCQPYYGTIYEIGTVNIVPSGVMGIFVADASFVEYENISAQIHIGNEELKYVYGYEGYPDVGTTVYKSGITTNNTNGTVEAVGEIFIDPFDMYLYNQTFASYYSAPGDSGSPVYTINQENQINIVGINVGLHDATSYSVFSPVSGIEDELGVVPYTVYDIPIPGQTLPPNDLDGDGLYEDLTGDGTFGFVDAEVFFQQMDWIEENLPVENFDFNGNGCIDFNDVVCLFGMIQ